MLWLNVFITQMLNLHVFTNKTLSVQRFERYAARKHGFEMQEMTGYMFETLYFMTHCCFDRYFFIACYAFSLAKNNTKSTKRRISCFFVTRSKTFELEHENTRAIDSESHDARG